MKGLLLALLKTMSSSKLIQTSFTRRRRRRRRRYVIQDLDQISKKRNLKLKCSFCRQVWKTQCDQIVLFLKSLLQDYYSSKNSQNILKLLRLFRQASLLNLQTALATFLGIFWKVWLLFSKSITIWLKTALAWLLLGHLLKKLDYFFPKVSQFN